MDGFFYFFFINSVLFQLYAELVVFAVNGLLQLENMYDFEHFFT